MNAKRFPALLVVALATTTFLLAACDTGNDTAPPPEQPVVSTPVENPVVSTPVENPVVETDPCTEFYSIEEYFWYSKHGRSDDLIFFHVVRVGDKCHLQRDSGFDVPIDKIQYVPAEKITVDNPQIDEEIYLPAAPA